MIKNNVTRFLTSKKIEFEGFELPKEKLGAVEAAEILGVDPSLVYKTIVIERIGKGKPILAVIPGNHQVNLKNTAKLLNEKKVALPTEAIAEKLTGLQAGGISPFALMNKGFQVLLSTEAEQHEYIYLSGGQRGFDIRLKTKDIVKVLRPKLGAISDLVE